MAFNAAEKAAIRGFCGYPAYGKVATGDRFFTQYGELEFRLNNMQPEEEAIVRNVYLERLAVLEIDMIDESRKNIDTESAAVWKRNSNEPQDRMMLFDNFRRRLCDFLGVPPGVGLRRRGVEIIV